MVQSGGESTLQTQDSLGALSELRVRAFTERLAQIKISTLPYLLALFISLHSCKGLTFKCSTVSGSMAPQGRGRATVTPLHPFNLGEPTTPEERTPRALPSDHPLASSSSADGDEEKEDYDEDDIGVDSQYTLDDGLSAESVGSGSDEDEEDDAPGQATFLQHSNSSFLTNAFAPPYYNRPPTPLPASPSLTSLLRPSFSTTTSRPTTPDSSEGDTPNDTEAAVAKSARTATTVPRASPKVPTYEYYGFVLYLLSSLGFRESLSLPVYVEC